MAGGLLPTGRGSINRGRFNRRPMAEINVTPFVDVILVLLIVFMVTAPMLTQGIDVQLPEVTSAPVTQSAEPLQVTIKANGDIFVQTREVPLANLAPRLQAIIGVRENTQIVLRADQNTSYGYVAQVLGALQQAGLINVALLTEPPQ